MSYKATYEIKTTLLWQKQTQHNTKDRKYEV